MSDETDPIDAYHRRNESAPSVAGGCHANTAEPSTEGSMPATVGVVPADGGGTRETQAPQNDYTELHRVIHAAWYNAGHEVTCG